MSRCAASDTASQLQIAKNQALIVIIATKTMGRGNDRVVATIQGRRGTRPGSRATHPSEDVSLVVARLPFVLRRRDPPVVIFILVAIVASGGGTIGLGHATGERG